MNLMVLADPTVSVSVGPLERSSGLIVGPDIAGNFAGEVGAGSEDAPGDQVALEFRGFRPD